MKCEQCGTEVTATYVTGTFELTALEGKRVLRVLCLCLSCGLKVLHSYHALPPSTPNGGT